MKHHVTTFLALVLLAQALAPLTGQLAKVPALMAHFYAHHGHAHHEHGDELGVLDFLAQHYGGQTHHDDASQDHSNLPFRCADASCAALLFALPSELPMPGISIDRVFQSGSVFGNDDWYSRLFGKDVFRPPLG